MRDTNDTNGSLGIGMRMVLLLAGFVIVVTGVKFAEPLLVPLFLAVIVTTVTLPVVAWLEKHRFPHALALLLALLLDLVVLAGVGTLVGSSIQSFTENLPQYQHRLTMGVRANVGWLEAHGVHLSPQLYREVTDVSGMVNIVSSVIARVANVVSSSLLVLLLFVFMLLEAGRWRTKIAYAMGHPGGELKRFSNAAHELQKYLFVKTGTNLVTGLLSGAWVAILGVDYALLWALLSFSLNYIPTLGSIIAGVPPFLLAWVQFGPGVALAVLAGYATINVVLGSVVEPRILGKALGLSPLVVLVSMVFWWWLWGPIGALLSAPLTMLLKIVLSNSPDLRWIAILLGSAEWVEEMRPVWAAHRPVCTYHKHARDQYCAHPEEASTSEIPGSVRTTDPPPAPITSTSIPQIVRSIVTQDKESEKKK